MREDSSVNVSIQYVTNDSFLNSVRDYNHIGKLIWQSNMITDMHNQCNCMFYKSEQSFYMNNQRNAVSILVIQC